MNKLIKNFVFLIIMVSFITINVYADDYPDDIYDGDYSIEDMLRNYSVVTFGQKDYDENATQLRDNFLPGSLRIFHIVGNYIVNGDIDLVTKNANAIHHAYRVDCMSIDNNRASYFTGTMVNGFFENRCSDNTYSSRSQVVYRHPADSGNIYFTETSSVQGTYMNIERLYNNIVESQSKIKKGRIVDTSSKTVHLNVGEEYYIEDINNIDNIIFDNLDDGDEKLTVITINNSGKISFPKIFKDDSYNMIPSNDYYRNLKPNGEYSDYYVIDYYHGNIIWNIPNATYIELPSAPFAGHLIAPKADVEGPELHFAGAFLVNSLALPDNSEAHFYPLTIMNIPYKSNIEPVKAKTNLKKNQGSIKFYHNLDPNDLGEGTVVSFKVEAEKNYLLSGMVIKDEEGNPVEYKEIGDGEYEFTMPATDVVITPQFKEKNLINTLTNPKTGRNFFIIFGVIGIISIVGYLIIKREKGKVS